MFLNLGRTRSQEVVSVSDIGCSLLSKHYFSANLCISLEIAGTALVLGPPLLAKFGVVLAVKFLTDLVVYPLLIIFRFAKDVKRKLFGNSEVNGEGVNGNSSSSS
jgi:hypothetical protein